MRNVATLMRTIAALSMVLFSTYASADLPPTDGTKIVPSLAPMLKNVLPTVVNIAIVGESTLGVGTLSEQNQSPGEKEKDTKEEDNGSSNDQNDSKGGPGKHSRKFESLGSGVIIDAKNGYIVTNSHVLRQARTINITLQDGRQRIAKVIGADPASDVAVLQIQADNLVALPFANSDNLQVGDFVVAIGNPFGLNETVTSGIVSGLQRNGLGLEVLENFIQTDAPINPGSSGGALVNLSGQLIGINTAILAPGGGNVGVGFAIPVNMMKSVVDQLVKFGDVHRGVMGVIIQNLTPALADAFNLPNMSGALVTTVTPNSPAFKAGIKSGDIIQKVNGRKVTTASQVTNAVGLLRVGAKVDVEILRNNKTLALTIITASPQDYDRNTKAENPFLYGVNLRNFYETNAIYGVVRGVQIVDLSEESPAWRAIPTGLRQGDVIVSANQRPVTSIDELIAAVKLNPKQLLLNVLRNEGALYVVIK